MEPPILDVISRIVHVFTAITLVGGSVFMAFVLGPAADELGEETHNKLREQVVKRWKKFVHGGIGLFLLSGFYNYAVGMKPHADDSLWKALVGVKMLIAFGIFFLASALVGRSKSFEGMRAQRAKWLKILVLLAAVVVGISGFVKVRGVPDSVGEAAAAESEETE
jgi:uncharacterized membrane protein